MTTKTAVLIIFLFAITTCKLRDRSSLLRERQNSSHATTKNMGITVHGFPVTTQKKDELMAALADKRPNNPDDSMIAKNGNSSTTKSNESTAYSLTEKQQTYIEKCAQLGVPTPPNWGDKNWKLVGKLDKDRIFALDSELTTTLYSYSTPTGSCAALPRVDNENKIAALGMICQGTSGNACFWDNVDPVTDEKITEPSKIQPPLLSNGWTLKENCTECHRGSNVFIVHQGTVLEKIQKQELKNKYAPIGQPGWENPEGDPNLAPNCQSCHTLPKLNNAYCEIVLLQSIRGSISAEGKQNSPTMPPKDVDRADYVNDITALEDACKKL